MKILVTGAAGFVGFHLVKQLLNEGHTVIGLDNLNSYYDVHLKLSRLSELGISFDNDKSEMAVSSNYREFQFVKMDIIDSAGLLQLFSHQKFELIVHLAAQAGVRYSIDNPEAYIQSNLIGFSNILEACRKTNMNELIFASSSSVYGNSDRVPFHENDRVDNPVSLYAATKKSNELIAYTYSHLYGIATTGLRFFTVYGPWGRPDMAPFLFTKAIMEGKPIKVFNEGNLSRDFTYIDDIVAGINAVVNKRPAKGAHQIFNIGNSKPEKLMEFIGYIEQYTGKTANKEMYPMQPGDVYQTYADTSALQEYCGYIPRTTLKDGLKKFIDWYKEYYH